MTKGFILILMLYYSSQLWSKANNSHFVESPCENELKKAELHNFKIRKNYYQFFLTLDEVIKGKNRSEEFHEALSFAAAELTAVMGDQFQEDIFLFEREINIPRHPFSFDRWLWWVGKVSVSPFIAEELLDRPWETKGVLSRLNKKHQKYTDEQLQLIRKTITFENVARKYINIIKEVPFNEFWPRRRYFLWLKARLPRVLKSLYFENKRAEIRNKLNQVMGELARTLYDGVGNQYLLYQCYYNHWSSSYSPVELDEVYDDLFPPTRFHYYNSL